MFDATLVPHMALLLFSGNEFIVSAPQKGASKPHRRQQQQQRQEDDQLLLQLQGEGSAMCSVTLNAWIRVQLTELHAVLARRLQREIEALLRLKVEQPHADTHDRQRILATVVQQLLLR